MINYIGWGHLFHPYEMHVFVETPYIMSDFDSLFGWVLIWVLIWVSKWNGNHGSLRNTFIAQIWLLDASWSSFVRQNPTYIKEWLNTRAPNCSITLPYQEIVASSYRDINWTNPPLWPSPKLGSSYQSLSPRRTKITFYLYLRWRWWLFNQAVI